MHLVSVVQSVDAECNVSAKIGKGDNVGRRKLRKVGGGLRSFMESALLKAATCTNTCADTGRPAHKGESVRWRHPLLEVSDAWIRPKSATGKGAKKLLVASLLLVVWPGAPSSALVTTSY